MNIRNKVIGLQRHIKVYNKPKIFGIGANKTGTTSLEAAMIQLGFVVGIQLKAEGFIEDWAKRDFSKIIRHCYSAQFFQDTPFSLPYTFTILDQAFPNSKFILTVRDSSEQWYDSLTKFHSKKWGKNGRIPIKEDLEAATYIYQGRPWRSNRLLFNTPEEEPYHKESLFNYYEQHNNNVLEYFRHRPSDLLVLNVAERDAYSRLCEFLEVTSTVRDFPWENKTKETR